MQQDLALPSRKEALLFWGGLTLIVGAIVSLLGSGGAQDMSVAVRGGFVLAGVLIAPIMIAISLMMGARRMDFHREMILGCRVTTTWRVGRFLWVSLLPIFVLVSLWCIISAWGAGHGGAAWCLLMVPTFFGPIAGGVALIGTLFLVFGYFAK